MPIDLAHDRGSGAPRPPKALRGPVGADTALVERPGPGARRLPVRVSPRGYPFSRSPPGAPAGRVPAKRPSGASAPPRSARPFGDQRRALTGPATTVAPPHAASTRPVGGRPDASHRADLDDRPRAVQDAHGPLRGEIIFPLRGAVESARLWRFGGCPVCRQAGGTFALRAKPGASAPDERRALTGPAPELAAGAAGPCRGGARDPAGEKGPRLPHQRDKRTRGGAERLPPRNLTDPISGGVPAHRAPIVPSVAIMRQVHSSTVPYWPSAGGGAADRYPKKARGPWETGTWGSATKCARASCWRVVR